jgi:hypothetical protein
LFLHVIFHALLECKTVGIKPFPSLSCKYEVKIDVAFEFFGKMYALGKAEERNHSQIDSYIFFWVFLEELSLESLFEWTLHYLAIKLLLL